MTFKHIKFSNSPVMRELERLSISKGEFKPEVVVKEVAMKKVSFVPTNDLDNDILKLAEGLRSKGFEKDAEALEAKFVLYKEAGTHLYRAIDEDGDDLIDFAHPDGEVRVGDSEHGVVETLLTGHKKMLDVVNKAPTGKFAKAANELVEDVGGILGIKEAQFETARPTSNIEGGISKGTNPYAIIRAHIGNLISALDMTKNMEEPYFYAGTLNSSNTQATGDYLFLSLRGPGPTIPIFIEHRDGNKVKKEVKDGELLKFYLNNGENLTSYYNEYKNGKLKFNDVFNENYAKAATDSAREISQLLDNSLRMLANDIPVPPKTLNEVPGAIKDLENYYARIGKAKYGFTERERGGSTIKGANAFLTRNNSKIWHAIYTDSLTKVESLVKSVIEKYKKVTTSTPAPSEAAGSARTVHPLNETVKVNMVNKLKGVIKNIDALPPNRKTPAVNGARAKLVGQLNIWNRHLHNPTITYENILDQMAGKRVGEGQFPQSLDNPYDYSSVGLYNEFLNKWLVALDKIRKSSGKNNLKLNKLAQTPEEIFGSPGDLTPTPKATAPSAAKKSPARRSPQPPPAEKAAVASMQTALYNLYSALDKLSDDEKKKEGLNQKLIDALLTTGQASRTLEDRLDGKWGTMTQRAIEAAKKIGVKDLENDRVYPTYMLGGKSDKAVDMAKKNTVSIYKYMEEKGYRAATGTKQDVVFYDKLPNAAKINDDNWLAEESAEGTTVSSLDFKSFAALETLVLSEELVRFPQILGGYTEAQWNFILKGFYNRALNQLRNADEKLRARKAAYVNSVKALIDKFTLISNKVSDSVLTFTSDMLDKWGTEAGGTGSAGKGKGSGVGPGGSGAANKDAPGSGRPGGVNEGSVFVGPGATPSLEQPISETVDFRILINHYPSALKNYDNYGNMSFHRWNLNLLRTNPETLASRLGVNVSYPEALRMHRLSESSFAYRDRYGGSKSYGQLLPTDLLRVQIMKTANLHRLYDMLRLIHKDLSHVVNEFDQKANTGEVTGKGRQFVIDYWNKWSDALSNMMRQTLREINNTRGSRRYG